MANEPDVLHAIALGVKEDLSKHGLFSFAIQSRHVKGRGQRVELIATQEESGFQVFVFKILFEGNRISLCDDGFSVEEGDFKRREVRDEEFHTFSDYEYADPESLRKLYEEVERRFVK